MKQDRITIDKDTVKGLDRSQLENVLFTVYNDNLAFKRRIQELAAKYAKIAEQSQQLFAAQLAASQAAQNDTLKSYVSGQLAYYNPRPVPSFAVPAPYQYAGCNSGYNYGCGGCAA